MSSETKFKKSFEFETFDKFNEFVKLNEEALKKVDGGLTIIGYSSWLLPVYTAGDLKVSPGTVTTEQKAGSGETQTLSATTTLQQAGTTMLHQANQSTQNTLSLLKP